MIELASEAARKQGRNLGAYEEPQARFVAGARQNYWWVHFSNKAGIFGGHFSVEVDDLIRTTRVVPGK